MEPILSVVCDEPGGEIERNVYPFILNDDNLAAFWTKASKYPYIFGRPTPPSQEEFFRMYFSVDPLTGQLRTENLIWVIDDYVGAMVLSNIYFPHDALVHFTFFDGRLKGRAPVLREMIKYVFDTYGLLRLSAEIPAYIVKANKVKENVLNFISDQVGLIFEGRKRKSVWYKSPKMETPEKFDVLLYGITIEDVEKWEHQKPKLLVAEQPSQ